MPCSRFGIARNPGILTSEAAEAYEMTGSRLKSLRPFAEFVSTEQRHAEREGGGGGTETERQRQIYRGEERERERERREREREALTQWDIRNTSCVGFIIITSLTYCYLLVEFEVSGLLWGFLCCVCVWTGFTDF